MGFVDSLQNMLFGDPVYDERGQVVKRNFGLMNAGVIVLLVVLGIGVFKGRVIFPNMKPKSGKKKMKGGTIPSECFGCGIGGLFLGAVVSGVIVGFLCAALHN